MHDYASRRNHAIERLGGGLLIVPAAPIAVRNHDNEYPYRQNSDLLYLTGFAEPESVLLLAAHRPAGEACAFGAELEGLLPVPQREIAVFLCL